MSNWSMGTAHRDVDNTRLFTVEQANRTLVLLQRIVGDIVNEYKTLMELEEWIDLAEQSGNSLALERSRKQLVATVDTLQNCLEELDQVGVELRDFTRGIVDFPASRDGRAISLCWRLGEAEVSYWHETREGYASRRPIEEYVGMSVREESLQG
jgi:hypothetical protein